MTKRSLVLPFLLGLTTVAALLWLVGPHQKSVGAASTTTRYVAVTGTDSGNDCAVPSAPCRTVQHAVDAASAGDVIKVAQGTYSDVHQRGTITQVIHITESVTLRGGYTTADGFAEPPQPEAHPTTLDAQQQGRVIVIDGAGPTVEGFTITGGAGYYSGGGIHVVAGRAVVLRHNRIVGNSAEGDGGGIFFNGGSGQILDSLIADNTSTWSAGLRIINNADVAVVGNEIRGNVAQNRAGGVDVDCCGGTTPLIARNLIVDNDGGGGGGGINVMFTNARLVNNVVALNRADRGAGILVEGSASFPVSVTLSHNTLVGQGGGDEGVRAEGDGAVMLVNNVVASYTTGITNTASASAVLNADHTLFDGNGTDHGPGVSSANAIIGSAAFVSPATGDYHITAASAAIDAGAYAGVSVDLDNEPRSGVPDVGADEYWVPGAFNQVYLPLVTVLAYPAHPPQIEPQPGEYFPCQERCDTGCTGDLSNWLLLDHRFEYEVVGENPWCAPWCDLEPGDVVIEVSGHFGNDSDVGYYTWVTGASYDADGDFLSGAIWSSPVCPPPSTQYVPTHGTGDFTVHLKSHPAIERIRIEAACASVIPPP